MECSEVIHAILNGELDSDFARITESIETREGYLATQRLASLKVGDRVRLKPGLSPTPLSSAYGRYEGPDEKTRRRTKGLLRIKILESSGSPSNKANFRGRIYILDPTSIAEILPEHGSPQDPTTDAALMA